MKVNHIQIAFDNGPAVRVYGEALAKIGVHINSGTYNKVNFIKAIRNKFGLGLLEAKLLAESLEPFAARMAPITTDVESIVNDDMETI